jgi:hypothetical protein
VALSCVLAWLLITAAVAMFVMEPRKATGVAALFCFVAGAFWLFDALEGCDATGKLSPKWPERLVCPLLHEWLRRTANQESESMRVHMRLLTATSLTCDFGI